MAVLTITGTPPAGITQIAYTFTPTIAGNIGETQWGLTGVLSQGLSFDPTTGTISGTPLVAGSLVGLTITAVDSMNNVGQLSGLEIDITLHITIMANGLLPGRVTDVYTSTPVVIGGEGAQTWSLAAGTLPAGLSLNTTTGAVSGTPTAAGSSTFTLSVTDGTGTTTSVITLVIIPILSNAIPTAEQEIGRLCLIQPTATDVVGIPTWSVSTGVLPPGLVMNPLTGVISGTPTVAGTFGFTVMIQDSTQTATVNTSITVASQLVSTLDPPAGIVNQNYTLTITPTGGVAPYEFGMFGGVLPPGLTLNPTLGIISGTPQMIGQWPFGLIITDSLGGLSELQVVLTITPGVIYATDVVILNMLAVLGPEVSAAITTTDWADIALQLTALTDAVLAAPSLEVLEALWTFHDMYKAIIAQPVVSAGLTTLADIRAGRRAWQMIYLFNTAITAPATLVNIDSFLRVVPNQRVIRFIEQKLVRILA